MAKKGYATDRQKVLIRAAGAAPRRGLTCEEAAAEIAEYVRVGRLTEEQVDEAWRVLAATPNQRGFLTSVGVEIKEGLTRGEAADLIAAKTAIAPMSEGQRDYIVKLHGIPGRGMSYREAGEYIEYLQENKPTCPNCSCNYPPKTSRCPFCGGFVQVFSHVEPPPRLGGKLGIRHPARKGCLSGVLALLFTG